MTKSALTKRTLGSPSPKATAGLPACRSACCSPPGVRSLFFCRNRVFVAAGRDCPRRRSRTLPTTARLERATCSDPPGRNPSPCESDWLCGPRHSWHNAQNSSVSREMKTHVYNRTVAHKRSSLRHTPRHSWKNGHSQRGPRQRLAPSCRSCRQPTRQQSHLTSFCTLFWLFWALKRKPEEARKVPSPPKVPNRKPNPHKPTLSEAWALERD